MGFQSSVASEKCGLNFSSEVAFIYSLQTMYAVAEMVLMDEFTINNVLKRWNMKPHAPIVLM